MDNVENYKIVSNSLTRDKVKYPNENAYGIELSQYLYGIKEIELCQATIPNSEYAINNDNNYLQVGNGVTTTSINITPWYLYI